MQKQFLTPQQLGIGMRISLHPHANNATDIIRQAHEQTQEALAAYDWAGGINVQPGDLATYVNVTEGAPAQSLAVYATLLNYYAGLEAGPHRVASQILLSRGEPVALKKVTGNIPAERAVFLERSGFEATAAWSLYPMTDGDASHVEPVEHAIESVKASGLEVTEAPHATLVRGPLSSVTEELFEAWGRVGEHVPHVASHISLTLESPLA